MTKRRKNQHGSRFVLLEHYLMNSEAWRSLTPAARSIYLEIRKRYNGSNNGRIGLSVRDAATLCRVAKDTAAKAFRELQDRRFIDCVHRGAFSLKVRHASEWRLTDQKCDVTNALPDRPFMRWKAEKQNPVSNQAVSVPDEGQQQAA